MASKLGTVTTPSGGVVGALAPPVGFPTQDDEKSLTTPVSLSHEPVTFEVVSLFFSSLLSVCDIKNSYKTD